MDKNPQPERAIGADDRTAVLRRLLDRAAQDPGDTALARDAALFHLIMETGARPLEVERLRPSRHLDLEAGELEIARYPQRNPDPRRPFTIERLALSPGLVLSLRAWMPHRPVLASALKTTPDALFLRLRGGWVRHRDGHVETWAKGLPLHARGIERRWRDLAPQLAHEIGRPLPVRLEKLRRRLGE